MRPAGPLSDRFRQLDTLDDLAKVLAAADREPVLIYKHSLTCGSSAWALEEVRALAEQTTVPIALVPVQTARPVSNEIAARFGVRHESPQLLIVERGRVLWHSSHSGVTAERIHEALAQIAAR